MNEFMIAWNQSVFVFLNELQIPVYRNCDEFRRLAWEKHVEVDRKPAYHDKLTYLFTISGFPELMTFHSQVNISKPIPFNSRTLYVYVYESIIFR